MSIRMDTDARTPDTVCSVRRRVLPGIQGSRDASRQPRVVADQASADDPVPHITPSCLLDPVTSISGTGVQVRTPKRAGVA